MTVLLIAHMLVTWCDDFPRAPDGLFCVGPERYVWNYSASTSPPLPAGHEHLRAHNVEVFIVQVPAVKPEPTSERPRDAIGPRVIARRP